MKEEEKRAICRNWGHLINNLFAKDLTKYFIEVEILDLDDDEEIRSFSTAIDQNDKFLKVISRKGSNSFETLINALRKENDNNTAMLLEKALTETKPGTVAVTLDEETSTAHAPSVIYQRRPLAQLDSQVSTDAIPLTPISSVRYEEHPSCVCPRMDQPDSTRTDQRSIELITDPWTRPITHSSTYPDLCQVCNRRKANSGSTSPISEAQSYTDLSTGADTDDNAVKDCHSMPDSLKVGYYDAMILYAEADRKEAIVFLNHLRNDIRLKNGEAIKVVLYDGEELSALSGLKLDQLDKAFRRCSYTFVYLTKNLVNDIWCKISNESMLLRTVDNKNENWRVVPVYTTRRTECKFRIPFGINALNGICYCENDEFYQKGVTALIEKTVPERKHKERGLKQKRRDWAEIHGQCHIHLSEDLAQEHNPNVVSNDELLVPTPDRLTMVQPQQSAEMDYCTFSDAGLAMPSTSRDKDCSFKISPELSAAVAVTQPYVPPYSTTSTSTTSNIDQSTSSVNIDLKLKCDNTDSVKIGIDVKKTLPAATSSDTQCSDVISKEEKTGQCWHCQYYVKELFCKYSIHSSHIVGWHCFFSFIDEHLKSTESHFAQSGYFPDPLDDPLD